MAATEQEHNVRTARGHTLAATLCLPEGTSPAGGWPGVLLCQGLSGVRNLVLPQVARTLAAAGMATLRFDYAGCGASTGDRGWIDPQGRILDAGFALADLAVAEQVDAGRLGVYGHSYGGPVAISVAAQDPRIRAVVSVSGPGSGADMLRAARPAWSWVELRHRLEGERAAIARGEAPTVVGIDEILPFSPKFAAAYARLKASQGGTSALDGDDGLGSSTFYLATIDAMLRLDPAASAARLEHCATLFVNGEDDDTAPIETVAPVFAAVAGEKHWHLVPGADHNDLDSDPGLGAALVTVADWFGQHL
jgi:pimeloyl-ACP methyl ester carboxylesterase